MIIIRSSIKNPILPDSAKLGKIWQIWEVSYISKKLCLFSVNKEDENIRRRRIRLRWYKAYTLVKNPSLVLEYKWNWKLRMTKIVKRAMDAIVSICWSLEHLIFFHDQFLAYFGHLVHFMFLSVWQLLLFKNTVVDTFVKSEPGKDSYKSTSVW